MLSKLSVIIADLLFEVVAGQLANNAKLVITVIIVMLVNFPKEPWLALKELNFAEWENRLV
jgi:hypothetical protein